MPNKKVNSRGIGVDSFGGHVIDPTENVKALTKAEARRQDDLRKAHEQLNNMRFHYIEKISDLRAAHEQAMADKESARLDSIRQVDVLNGSVSATQAQTAIQTLATSTTNNAENIKTTVAATAKAKDDQLATQFSRIEERLTSVERAQYEGVGKQRVTDPQMQAVIEKLDTVMNRQTSTVSAGEGSSATWKWIALGIGVIGTLIGTAATFVALVVYLSKH
jgi:chromosome segregation ATPase